MLANSTSLPQGAQRVTERCHREKRTSKIDLRFVAAARRGKPGLYRMRAVHGEKPRSPLQRGG